MKTNYKRILAFYFYVRTIKIEGLNSMCQLSSNKKQIFKITTINKNIWSFELGREIQLRVFPNKVKQPTNRPVLKRYLFLCIDKPLIR